MFIIKYRTYTGIEIIRQFRKPPVETKGKNKSENKMVSVFARMVRSPPVKRLKGMITTRSSGRIMSEEAKITSAKINICMSDCMVKPFNTAEAMYKTATMPMYLIRSLFILPHPYVNGNTVGFHVNKIKLLSGTNTRKNDTHRTHESKYTGKSWFFIFLQPS